MTYLCIKPRCPPTCDGCNHAIPPCKRCGAPMQIGIAIAETCVGSVDFHGDVPGARGSTISAGGPGHVTDCAKCSACGWSHTLPQKG